MVCDLATMQYFLLSLWSLTKEAPIRSQLFVGFLFHKTSWKRYNGSPFSGIQTALVVPVLLSYHGGYTTVALKIVDK
jgi:hypothetical protein